MQPIPRPFLLLLPSLQLPSLQGGAGGRLLGGAGGRLQFILVAIVLLLSVGYAVWRIRKAVSEADDPCAGCAGCILREQQRKQVRQQHKTKEKAEKPPCYTKK